jgi:hypothetical protein
MRLSFFTGVSMTKRQLNGMRAFLPAKSNATEESATAPDLAHVDGSVERRHSAAQNGPFDLANTIVRLQVDTESPETGDRIGRIATIQPTARHFLLRHGVRIYHRVLVAYDVVVQGTGEYGSLMFAHTYLIPHSQRDPRGYQRGESRLRPGSDCCNQRILVTVFQLDPIIGL